MENPFLIPSISQLSRPTSATLRSSVVIPTLPQFLSELVQNSLDAGSSRIDCWVDLTKDAEYIRVLDDGCGIREQDLERVGQRYESSKRLVGLAPSRSYGFRGEALSSVASLALLDVTTKTATSEISLAKVIKNSKVLFNGPTSRASIYTTSGTLMVVRDLFNLIPVRRSALAAESVTATITACKKVVEAFALIRPDVSWSLCEERSIGTSGNPSRRILSLSGGKSIVDMFRAIYGMANVKTVQKVRVGSGDKRIEGFISLEGSITKSHQHLYINGQPIDRGELHSLITKRFSASRFSLSMAYRESDLGEDSYRRKSPRQLERYPIYVLKITIPPSSVDLAYEPRKSAVGFEDDTGVKGLLLAVVEEYLRRQGLASALSVPVVQSTFIDSPTRTLKVKPITDPATPVKTVAERKRPSHCNSRAERPKSPVKRQKLCSHSRDESYAQSQDCSAPAQFPTPHIPPATKVNLLSRLHNVRSQRRTDISFTPDALAKARIINQVDNSFIACILRQQTPDSTENVLVLLDQHAADERASVEAVLEELCEGFIYNNLAQVDLGNTSPRVILSRQEAETLQNADALDVLARWGIRIEVPVDAEGHFIQVVIQSAPQALASRLSRKHGIEMTRLLRSYIPVLEEQMGELRAMTGSIATNLSVGGEVDWGRVMAWMPREMVELANSKACRSSVMFGDRLDIEQCGRLVTRLSTARQPFTCAHGRPVLAPLTVVSGHRPASRRDIQWQGWSGGRQT